MEFCANQECVAALDIEVQQHIKVRNQYRPDQYDYYCCDECYQFHRQRQQDLFDAADPHGTRKRTHSEQRRKHY